MGAVDAPLTSGKRGEGTMERAVPKDDVAFGPQPSFYNEGSHNSNLMLLHLSASQPQDLAPSQVSLLANSNRILSIEFLSLLFLLPNHFDRIV